jgi:hypothetical protein
MTQKKRRPGNPRIKDLGIATRFQPGQSGNPGGRPKTRILAEMLAAIGNEIEPKSGKTFFQVAAEQLVGKVFRGDVQAFKEFADRVDGRSTQHVELTGSLQAGHHGEWEQAWQKATPEERERMETELDDKLLAAAERIKLQRADTPENRYRARLREYERRKAAGETHEAIQEDFAKRPLLLESERSTSLKAG